LGGDRIRKWRIQMINTTMYKIKTKIDGFSLTNTGSLLFWGKYRIAIPRTSPV
jgi:hypothetical protein